MKLLTKNNKLIYYVVLNVNGFARVVANIQVAYRFFTCKMGQKW